MDFRWLTASRRAATGNRDADEAVLRRLRRRVHLVSTAILRHAQDAEDATQASLLEILRRAPTFHAARGMESWAAHIAVREALRLSRERRLHAAHALADGLDGSPDATQPVALSAEIPRHIREYLNELPETLRNTLVLRHVLGYTVPEIAQLFDTSPNTIKDRLARARSAIRRMIRRETLATLPFEARRS